MEMVGAAGFEPTSPQPLQLLAGLASTLDSSLLPFLPAWDSVNQLGKVPSWVPLPPVAVFWLPPDFDLAEALMRVQSQSRVMPNVFKVGNVVKRLIWTRMS